MVNRRPLPVARALGTITIITTAISPGNQPVDTVIDLLHSSATIRFSRRRCKSMVRIQRRDLLKGAQLAVNDLRSSTAANDVEPRHAGPRWHRIPRYSRVRITASDCDKEIKTAAEREWLSPLLRRRGIADRANARLARSAATAAPWFESSVEPVYSRGARARIDLRHLFHVRVPLP
jgi:hypothetical protein